MRGIYMDGSHVHTSYISKLLIPKHSHCWKQRASTFSFCGEVAYHAF